MNFTAIVVWYKSVAATLNGLVAVSSLLVVPMLVVAPIAWLTEGHTHLRSNLRTSGVGEYQRLSGDLQFERAPLKVTYKMELVNPISGEVVSFPTVETKGVPHFDNTLLPVPKSLKPGTYVLRANVHYVTNPLVAQNEVVEVSTIVVD
jgi:hypothetical protein